MAEEGPEAAGEAVAGVDPAAMALALGSASRERADAFLKKQEALIDDQRHHLARQYTQLGLGIWQMRLGVLLRVSTAFVGLAVAAALASLTWNAAGSNDLVMEPFSMPADLAQSGLTGEVMAGDLSGRIADMLAAFSSYRAPQSYDNNFGAGIKIEIPETGVSLAELDRFLREKLGHDVHITGAVVHTPAGLKLTVHAGELGNASVEGAENDLDRLQQRLAEALFGITQPYRFGIYLDQAGRHDEAGPVFKRLVNGTSIRERAWGYVGLGNNGPSVAAPGDEGGRELYLRALETDPENGLAMSNLAKGEMRIYPEQALFYANKFLGVLTRPDRYQIDPILIGTMRLQAEVAKDQMLGAFRDAVQKSADPQFMRKTYPGQLADIGAAERGEHDLGAARATMANAAPTSQRDGFQSESERLLIPFSAKDWNGVLQRVPVLEAFLAKNPGFGLQYHLDTEPYVAVAEAGLGRFDEAEKHVAGMPEDCYPCLIARAKIAELKGDRAQADVWFDRAVTSAPSIPLAENERAKTLLARGKAEDAIAKFKLANQKGPHFADPLEGWGEALMAQNKSHLALEKFAEAEKYAPNWGRLHLKWGEALAYAGKKDQAKAQFTRAAALDLTQDEKNELAGFAHG